MHAVQKKSPPNGLHRRLLLLGAALLLLGGVICACIWLSGDTKDDWPVSVSTAENLFEYASSEVVSVTIRRGESAPWTLLQKEGVLSLQGEADFPLSLEAASALLNAARILPCEAVLTDDPAEYADHLADFGLDAPRYEAIINYSDGVTVHLSVGNPGTENKSWYYMTVEGDDRLFTFSRGMVEALFVSRDSLRELVSPTIHKARIDRMTLSGPDGVIEWSLSGDIADSDAADKWNITAPFVYPADANAMAALLANISNLRLGAYVGPATAENCRLYGFDEPRLTIDIHMAAGTLGVTNPDGALETVDWPESTVTFIIGGAQSDMVDYVRYGDSIYMSSHFTMGMFIGYDVKATMSRYPVLTALGNLASLSIVQDGNKTEYLLTRREQVAENNALVTDEDGNVLYDVSVTRNGQALDYNAFAAAYSRLCLVTVSGTLPEGEESTAEPHTVLTFADVDGTVHTVALATFDVLHDAVIVDGHQAFYLIKGGLSFILE